MNSDSHGHDGYDAVMAEDSHHPSEHLVDIGDGWSLWRWLRLRGAGFPASNVERLTATKTSQLLDALFEAEARVQEHNEELCRHVVQLMQTASTEEDRRLSKLLRKLKKGKLPASESVSLGLVDLEPLARLHQDLDAKLLLVEQAYASDAATLSDQLSQLASTPRFQEAILWQNRAGFDTGVARVCSRQGTGTKYRQYEHLVARYAQRYSAKNDMIGFFGPQGGGVISEQPQGHLSVGQSFLRKRTVYFEHWAIAAVADALARIDELRWYVRPRLVANVRLSGDVLYYPNGDENTLPDEFSEVLAHCDGSTFICDIATKVLDGELELEDEGAVLEILEILADKGIISMTFSLPTTRLDAEEDLRILLTSLPDSVQEVGLSILERFVEAKQTVADAAGDPTALAKALDAVNEQFESITGEESSRSAGKAYAGRTLVFEECFRDTEFRLGQDTLKTLAPPLKLVLQSARWFTYTIAKRFEKPLRDAYARLSATQGLGEVTYLRYWQEIRSLFGTGDEPAPIVAQVQQELRDRWGEILNIDTGSRTMHFTASDLASAVEQTFAAPRPGWPAARYHSPDVMLIAKDHQAIERGEVRFVLGEVHAAVNTCGVRDYLTQIDTAEELIAARQRDLPEPALVPVISRENASRVDHVWLSPKNIEMELGATPSACPPEQVVRVSDLVIEEQNGSLEVFDRHNRFRFSLIQTLENHLSASVLADFTYLPSDNHTPRITIDDVIIGRESWRFKPEELAFSTLPRGVALFAEARRWAKAKGLPQRVFVKIPEENKPIFIDFNSIISVEILAKLGRKATNVSISEMLPDVNDLWLTDAHGSTYTAELRIVAVDPTSAAFASKPQQ